MKKSILINIPINKKIKLLDWTITPLSIKMLITLNTCGKVCELCKKELKELDTFSKSLNIKKRK